MSAASERPIRVHSRDDGRRRRGGRRPRRRGTCPGTARSARASSIQSGRGRRDRLRRGRERERRPRRRPAGCRSSRYRLAMRGSMYVSPLARVARAVPATLPPSGIVRRRSMGSRPGSRRRKGIRCPDVEAPRTMPRSAPPVPRPPPAARAGAAAPEHGRARGPAPPLRALPPHAADGRGRVRLRDAPASARLRAVPAAAPRGARALASSCTRRSTSAPSASGAPQPA